MVLNGAGVMIVHDWVMPMLVASQSHAPDVGTHWRITSPPADMSWQVKPDGHATLRQSRPQNRPPVGWVRHRSAPIWVHSASVVHAEHS